MNRLKNSDKFLIKMAGQGHAFSAVANVDAFNWELNFSNAYPKGDKAALERLGTMDSFTGYGEDSQQFKYQRVQ